MAFDLTSTNNTTSTNTSDIRANTLFVAVLKFSGLSQILSNIPAILVLVYILIKRAQTKYLVIVSLGVTDFLLGCSLVFMSEILNSRTVQFNVCRVSFSLSFSCWLASCLHIIGINLQRIQIVLIPNHVHGQIISRRKDVIKFSAMWLFALILVSVPFILYPEESHYEMCTLYSLVVSEDREIHKYLGTLFGMTSVVIVLTAAVLLIFLLKATKKPLPGNNATEANNSLNYVERRALVTVLMITCMYLIVTSPFHIVWTFFIQKPYLGITLVISMLNSFFNPFIYLLRVKQFRKILKKIFTRGHAVQPTQE